MNNILSKFSMTSEVLIKISNFTNQLLILQNSTQSVAINNNIWKKRRRFFRSYPLAARLP
jgi:hypothetical protein